jgi:hypothetical protein
MMEIFIRTYLKERVPCAGQMELFLKVLGLKDYKME